MIRTNSSQIVNYSQILQSDLQLNIYSFKKEE